ncbi:AbrB family transcriptional regulator [Glutamicibacter arilaitensis]|uniref:AbrB family transcriptional regulator n=1 Tax=Glutamicibacter arilaitensis TaxID=256701 RepID=UPI00384B6EB6
MSPALLLLLGGGVVGAVAARLLKLPMWPITGSIVGSAAAALIFSVTAAVPSIFGFFAQVLIGTAVGAAILPGFLKQLRRLLLPAVVIAGLLISVGIGGACLAIMTGMLEPRVALLGLVPGGVGEMVAASTALNADSALVAGLHILRLLASLWTLPLLIRWANTWKSPKPPNSSNPA